MALPKSNDLSALKTRCENAIKRQPYQTYVYVEPRILLMLIGVWDKCRQVLNLDELPRNSESVDVLVGQLPLFEDSSTSL